MRTQTPAGLTPEAKPFRGSYGFFGRRVGPRACFKIHLLHLFLNLKKWSPMDSLLFV